MKKLEKLQKTQKNIEKIKKIKIFVYTKKSKRKTLESQDEVEMGFIQDLITKIHDDWISGIRRIFETNWSTAYRFHTVHVLS